MLFQHLQCWWIFGLFPWGYQQNGLIQSGCRCHLQVLDGVSWRTAEWHSWKILDGGGWRWSCRWPWFLNRLNCGCHSWMWSEKRVETLRIGSEDIFWNSVIQTIYKQYDSRLYYGHYYTNIETLTWRCCFQCFYILVGAHSSCVWNSFLHGFEEWGTQEDSAKEERWLQCIQSARSRQTVRLSWLSKKFVSCKVNVHSNSFKNWVTSHLMLIDHFSCRTCTHFSATSLPKSPQILRSAQSPRDGVFITKVFEAQLFAPKISAFFDGSAGCGCTVDRTA